MSELRVESFEQVQALANEFNVASEQLQELIAFTDRVGGEMRGIWEGEAIENFMENDAEIKSALSKMVPIVAEMKSDADRKLDYLRNANR